MALKLAARVHETTTTTGTGTINLAGVVSSPAGRQTFVSGIGTGNACPYLADDGAGNWETGFGTVTSGSPDTLTRDVVVGSSNNGAKVNFGSGTKDVKLIDSLPIAPPTCEVIFSTTNNGNKATTQAVLFDSASAWNSNTNTYVTPYPGRYMISAIFEIQAATGLIKNGIKQPEILIGASTYRRGVQINVASAAVDRIAAPIEATRECAVNTSISFMVSAAQDRIAGGRSYAIIRYLGQ